MDITFVIVVLALITMLALIVFALVSKAKLEARMEDPSAAKSSLAADRSSDAKPADV